MLVGRNVICKRVMLDHKIAVIAHRCMLVRS